jgi:hypothetical protein
MPARVPIATSMNVMIVVSASAATSAYPPCHATSRARLTRQAVRATSGRRLLLLMFLMLCRVGVVFLFLRDRRLCRQRRDGRLGSSVGSGSIAAAAAAGAVGATPAAGTIPAGVTVSYTYTYSVTMRGSVTTSWTATVGLACAARYNSAPPAPTISLRRCFAAVTPAAKEPRSPVDEHERITV